MSDQTHVCFGQNLPSPLIRDAPFLAADRREIDARRQQTVSEHQQRIGQYLRLGAFDTAGSKRRPQFPQSNFCAS